VLLVLYSNGCLFCNQYVSMALFVSEFINCHTLQHFVSNIQN
jgi:hypothetical protein